MAVALPLPDRLHPEIQKATEFKAIKYQFGDGYMQAAPNGINPRVDRWRIKWMNVTESEKNTIIAALNQAGTWDIITWTPFDESVQKKFRMDDPGYTFDYGITAPNRRRYTITISLTQMFDL